MKRKNKAIFTYHCNNVNKVLDNFFKGYYRKS